MRLQLILGLGTAIVFPSCKGQTNYPKEMSNTTVEQVITGDTVSQPGNNIMVVFQDSRDIYWFGSWETGVYRYDGHTIIRYTTRHGLPQDRIDEIKEDKYGNIYFNSSHPVSAITRFDGKKFTRLTAAKSDKWELSAHDLWFRHPQETGQVYRFDGTVLHLLQLPQPPKLSNPFAVYSIYKDSKGSIWFGTNPVGVCRYNGKSWDWITENDVTELDDGPANGVRSIIEDREGRFWFNSSYRYRVSDSLSVQGKFFYERQKGIGSLDGRVNGGLTEYLSITRDHQDNLWIATYRNGVWKYDGSKIQHYPVQENGKDINIFCIYTDNHGDLWLGTHKNGLWKLNGQAFERFTL